MPRWASRITLEVTAVRCELVREISEEDAEAEGVVEPFYLIGRTSRPGANMKLCRQHFEVLWQSLYPGSWDRNDYVFVYEFKRVEG
jgi:hypothetical protein